MLVIGKVPIGSCAMSQGDWIVAGVNCGLMVGNVPAGYHAITPYFTVADADRLIAFMTGAFDGQVLIEDRSENGRVRHARVRIGDSIVMLNEAGDDYAANESQMHLFVVDVDAAFTRALQEGASALMEPNNRPHGDRMAGFRDPCANTWWIASLG